MDPSFRKLFLICAAALIIPFAVYACSRGFGFLPSEEAWLSQGINHGPWRGEWQGLLLYLPFFSLFYSVMSFIKFAVQKNFALLRSVGFLIIAQLITAPLPLMVLFWTVD